MRGKRKKEYRNIVEEFAMRLIALKVESQGGEGRPFQVPKTGRRKGSAIFWAQFWSSIAGVLFHELCASKPFTDLSRSLQAEKHCDLA